MACGLDVSCWLCHHRAILSADSWPDQVPMPSFEPRMVCTLAHGFTIEMLDVLVRDGLATAEQRAMRAGGSRSRLPGSRTDAGRQAFAG
jgi:hypothetical protein